MASSSAWNFTASFNSTAGFTIMNLSVILDNSNNQITSLSGTITYGSGSPVSDLNLLVPNTYLGNDNEFFPTGSISNIFTTNGLAFSQGGENQFNLYNNNFGSSVNDTLGDNSSVSITNLSESCILSGTLINTPSGKKIIDLLKVGDEIESFNKIYQISNIFVSKLYNNTKLVEITPLNENNETFYLSQGHAILINNEWKGPSEFGFKTLNNDEINKLIIDKNIDPEKLLFHLELTKNGEKLSRRVATLEIEGREVESFSTELL